MDASTRVCLRAYGAHYIYTNASAISIPEQDISRAPILAPHVISISTPPSPIAHSLHLPTVGVEHHRTSRSGGHGGVFPVVIKTTHRWKVRRVAVLQLGRG